MAMVDPNTSEKPISETHLRALYALLPGALKEDLYGVRFSKQLQAWRETLHPHGKMDIRALDGLDGLTVQVNLGDRLGCDIYYGFIQEIWDYSLFMATLKPGDIAVDIGANFGMYTLGAAKRLVSGGRVFAFEPDARSLSLLQENIRLNKFENLVTSLDVCVGSYDGEIDFYAAADPSFSGIYDTNRSETTGRLTLPIRRLDSVMQEHGITRINKIKIDVEGAEHEVLKGAAEILKNSDALIMLEISPKNLDKDRVEQLAVMLEILETQGYISFLINCETSPSVLVIDEHIKNIPHNEAHGETRNYFLVKRSGKEFQYIQEAFKLLELGPASLLKNNMLMPDALLENNSKSMEVLDHLHSIIWAAKVEKKVVVDSCRQKIARSHALELMLAKTGNELAAQKEENAAFKARLAETGNELAEQKEENTIFKAKLAETGNELAAQKEENAAIGARLAETGNELAAQKEDKAAFKAKLAKATSELSALNSGFLGLLFKIKKRWLNRGAPHD
ncbi:MAG: hypothetical protein A2Z65_00950 [Gallionellales bacterium RIFCSPLOWO2_02_58_13]|nr:MAG: hypothetical protein A2Z65_00950 [Gallionellales bacterium RIFCSPLOWO2_02_58_13]